MFFGLLGISSADEARAAPSVVKVTRNNAANIHATLAKLIQSHQINTAGIAVINQGKLVLQTQYGMQSEQIPASNETLFNAASLTKPVVAETILRLVEQGKLSLDESVAAHWIDPDLKDDPRVQQLTPRMLLSHTSGFMNWRFFSDDGKLAFINEPGETFGYSGEGYEYLAKYAENKLNQPFEKLVQETLFKTLGMKRAFLTVDPTNFAQIAKPYDENGKFYGYYCNPYGYCAEEGSFSAAANLVISVEDYAKFLIASMSGTALSDALRAKRDSLQGIQFTQEDIVCNEAETIPCPKTLGYGLGWSMSLFDNMKLIGHRGTNWKVVSLAYYYPETRDGLVIFFNAPNKLGLAAMVDALELLDPDSPEILGYRLRAARTH
jgi:CubicO group peptidase (beta-lactamase class C family)